MFSTYDVIVVGGGTAGVIAALSAQTGRDVMDLPIQDIRNMLQQHGAIVPEQTNSLEGTQP